jgi:hypothetical protein
VILRGGTIPAFRLAFFGIQFCCILLVCLDDIFSIFSRSSTLFPTVLDKFWGRAAETTLVPLGLTLPEENPVRQTVAAYLNLAGIEAGYSFFAPNVPDSYKIVFELHYPDGRTEIELPRLNGRSAGLRFATLLDNVAETEYDPLRTMMVKMLAFSVWQDHPSADKIRAVLGSVELPTPDEFRLGRKESYHVLFAYNFDFTATQPSHP